MRTLKLCPKSHMDSKYWNRKRNSSMTDSLPYGLEYEPEQVFPLDLPPLLNFQMLAL